LNRDPCHSNGVPPAILLVDGDEALCERLAREFSARGFPLRIAHTAARALECARADRPRDAIVALRLPDQSGIKLIAELLAIEPRMRVVVLTGYPSISTAVEAIKLGATNYLPKPANAAQLLAALNHGNGDADASLDQDPMSLHRIGWEFMMHALHDNKGNISATARALSIDRRTLQRKLQKRPAPIDLFTPKRKPRVD
jgi:two-component system response regulator RegA